LNKHRYVENVLEITALVEYSARHTVTVPMTRKRGPFDLINLWALLQVLFLPQASTHSINCILGLTRGPDRQRPQIRETTSYFLHLCFPCAVRVPRKVETASTSKQTSPCRAARYFFNDCLVSRTLSSLCLMSSICENLVTRN